MEATTRGQPAPRARISKNRRLLAAAMALASEVDELSVLLHEKRSLRVLIRMARRLRERISLSPEEIKAGEELEQRWIAEDDNNKRRNSVVEDSDYDYDDLHLLDVDYGDDDAAGNAEPDGGAANDDADEE